MNDRNGKLDFSPRFEYIDKRDIRTAFALPRFDEFSKMRELNKPYNAEMPGWSLFRNEPMTHQTFTSEDFESDASSVSSAGSAGSGHGQQPLRSRMTRGSRVHHIPILVEARDDSSGYSTDTRSEENNQTPVNHKESSTPKPVVQQKSSQSKTPAYQPSATPAQRSMSNQEVAAPRPQQVHPKKSSSQPPSTPPPQPVQQPGPFVTQVRVNMPVTVESKKAQQSQEKKTEKPKPDPLKQIQAILCDMVKFREEVEKFAGTTKDKQYRYLDEMLTRLMLRLDDVNTEGQDGIRQERKNAVKLIQSCITRLEQKIAENESSQQTDEQASNGHSSPPNGENGTRNDQENHM